VSALCGVVGLDGRPWSEADLEGMMRALAPLGPDGGGIWAGTAGRCGVAVGGALRRSTPEDSAERQPASSADGSLILAGDLRLDNRDELAAALGLADERSVPDGAFVLAAYERWGEALPERILGDFALAIVDRRRGGVLLARDHVGMRPLVVHQRPGVVAFASTAHALTAFDGVGHALDVRRVVEVLALALNSERTFVDGVRWLPPAGALWVDPSGTREWDWWNADPHEIVDLGSAAAHERELREGLERAVAARLRSAGPVGAMTSGGLDSPSVTATAALQLAPRALPTYTSAPPPGWNAGERPGWDADESALVTALADLHPNMTPSFVHVRPGEDLFAMHEPLWELGAGPVRNPCNWLWYHAIETRAAGDGVTTILTGGRGNLFFSSDGPEWLASLLRAGRPVAALREAAKWGRASGDGLLRTLRNRLVFPLLPAPVQRLARRATGRPDPAQDWIAHSALRPEVAAELDLPRLKPIVDERRDTREVELHTMQAAATQADTFTAMSALTGVEERGPTDDRRVIEAAMRQPEWVRRHDGIGRAVARGAMSDRLPAAIAQRDRRGEQLPDWLEVMTAARPQLERELEELDDHPTSRQLIDTERLHRLMGRWPDRSQRADPAVVRDYRVALLRALFISRYLRWFERRASRAASGGT